MQTPDYFSRLFALGISYDHAVSLRRISMTLNRWFELECGDSDSFGSREVVRGRKTKFYKVICDDDHNEGEAALRVAATSKTFATWQDAREYAKTVAASRNPAVASDSSFEYDDDGKPYMRYHSHKLPNSSYSPIADRERGAMKRLVKIMGSYPALSYYIQGDCRGASLYIGGKDMTDSNYSSFGVAVYK